MSPSPSSGQKWRNALLAAAAWPAPSVARLKCLLPATQRSRSIVNVIGDSHVSVFSGRDVMIAAWPKSTRNETVPFETYRLGPVLAYRLPDLGTTSRGREKLLLTLAYGRVPPKGTVLLCFGEIDCRYHLPKQIETGSRSVEEVVAECVARYAAAVLEVQRMGFRTCVWGVIPSGEADPNEPDPEYPFWGTAQQRNDVIRTFNRLLRDRLEPRGVPVVVIFDRLIGSDGLPLREYYLDQVHLSSAALPIAVDAIQAALG